ncbi:MAG: hypothetical protein KDK78_03855 [Chlamydiia bacterium]|nr:hypothetical protein [Chlamydiia bacterium]
MSEFTADDADRTWYVHHALKQCRGCQVLMDNGEAAKAFEQLQALRGGAQAFGFRSLYADFCIVLENTSTPPSLSSILERLEALAKKWKPAALPGLSGSGGTEVAPSDERLVVEV